MNKLIAISLIIVHSLASAADYGVGQRDFTFTDTSRSRTLSTHVWYPVDAKVEILPIAQEGNPFIPVLSAKDVPIVERQKFPVVLLSHGSGGKADKLFWLTNRFVRAGLVVVAVDHSGNMTGDNSADGMMRVWNRSKDLSFALDQITELEFFKGKLDLNKVTAIGHSAGGATVLLLAGAKLSWKKLSSPIPTCSGTKDPYLAKICIEMKSINLKSYPKQVVEADYSDSRVKAVVALDPGFVRSFDTGSFKKLKAKPFFFLADKMNTSHDQILAKEFAKYFPAKVVKIVPDSYHMTFLQACKADYPKDDPELAELCVGNEKKIEIQKQVVDESLEFFKSSWGRAERAE